jgi:hypothetical protein
MYFWLGDTLLMRSAYAEADTVLRKGLDLKGATADVEQQALILRDLIYTAVGLKRPPDIDKWFDALDQTGHATWSDCSQSRFSSLLCAGLHRTGRREAKIRRAAVYCPPGNRIRFERPGSL